MKSNYLKYREDVKNKHIKYEVLIGKKPTSFQKGLKNSIGKEHSQMTNAKYNLELSSLLLTVHKYFSEKASLKDTFSALAHYNHLYWITTSASSSHNRTWTHKFPWLVLKEQHITPDQKTEFLKYYMWNNPCIASVDLVICKLVPLPYLHLWIF